jgi:hypothetical protein
MKKSTFVVGFLLSCSLLGGQVVLAQTAQPGKPSAAVSDGKIHGNKKSMAYHLPSCPSYGKIKAENTVSFNIEDEATKAGYHKAKNCK